MRPKKITKKTNRKKIASRCVLLHYSIIYKYMIISVWHRLWSGGNFTAFTGASWRFVLSKQRTWTCCDFGSTTSYFTRSLLCLHGLFWLVFRKRSQLAFLFWRLLLKSSSIWTSIKDGHSCLTFPFVVRSAFLFPRTWSSTTKADVRPPTVNHFKVAGPPVGCPIGRISNE